MTPDSDKKSVPYETPWRAALTQKTRTGQRHLMQYIVDFTGPDGASAWWEVLFNSIEEAARWAEWELERAADGNAGWTAKVGAGHWEHDEQAARFVVDVERLATVGPSTGRSPATGTAE